MLDAVLRRQLDGYTAPVAARVAAFGVGANRLTVVGFLCGAIALFDISHRYYLIGLGFLVLARLLDMLDGRVAALKGITVLGAYLKQVLDVIVTTAVPFAFALAQPGRALAAMFLMLGLVARAGAADSTALPIGQDPVVVYFGRVGNLIEKTELFLAFALACIFPDQFSIIAYILGILCFIAVGGRVATATVHRP